MAILRTRIMVVVASLLSLAAVAGDLKASPLEAMNFADGQDLADYDNITVGWTFTVTKPVAVVSLGWFNGVNGRDFTVPHDVGIFASTGGAPLAWTTVTTSDPLTPSSGSQPGDGFRYHTLSTPLHLTPGSYAIGGYNPSFGGGQKDGFWTWASGVSTVDAITYGAGVYAFASGSLKFPNQPTDRGRSYFGPDFQIERHAAISVNFAADYNNSCAVGTNTAGVVPVGNWNDVTMGAHTNLPLKDSSGNTVPGLTLSVPAVASYDSLANFGAADPGDTAMMRGHEYLGGNQFVDLTFTGTIPYDHFDVYVYYNSGNLAASAQTFSILDSNGTSLGITPQIGYESAGIDSAFVRSDGVGGNNANYVLFAGLARTQVPGSFIIRAQANPLVNQYAYFNGLQIVQAVPEPQSFAMALGALFGLVGWIGFARRCRREP